LAEVRDSGTFIKQKKKSQKERKKSVSPFPIPAEWVQGEFPHCSLRFTKMAKRQKRR
jgi:hypothetical protein